MNRQTNLWKRLSITTKFGFTLAVQLVLIVAVVLISYYALSLSRQGTDNALESIAVQQLVAEINLNLQRARVLEQNFYQEYPIIGVNDARQQYALPAVSILAEIVQSSQQLQTLIDTSDSIGVQLKESDVDINLFLSSADRNAEIFLRSVDLVSQLAAPNTGLESQLDQHAEAVFQTIAPLNNAAMNTAYYEMRLAEKDYLLRRQRPSFQVAFNQANILQTLIRNSGLDNETTATTVQLLEEYVSIGEDIITTDVDLNSTFSEFALQASTIDPISAELINLSNLEVENSRAQVEETAAFVQLLLVVVAIAALIITLLTGYLLNNTITRNVLRLTSTARQLADGDLNVRTNIDSQDEVGVLASTLNSMADQLKSLIDNLEERVAARTRDLEIAAEVSKEAVTVIDPEALLPRVAERTREAFGLYHVSIFEYSDERDALVLEYGTGEAGQQMKQENKSFKLHDTVGLVPRAARERSPIVINDIGHSPDHFRNPILPNTRSEVALPMLYGDQLIGVLDLQSEEINRFSSDDLRVLQTLADRIAVSIHNAELFRDTLIAREAAEQADQVKSAFLASMSHELRTPLNAIINFSKFLKKGIPGPVNDEQAELIGSIADSGQHLLNLINDVLDMSKIEAGSLKLYIERDIDFNQIINTALEYTSPLLEEKPVTVQQDVPENLPYLIGDRKRLLQIVLNILSNACKFTEEGFVNIRVQEKDQSLLVTIEDTGPGIAPEDGDDVFSAFKQTESGIRQGGGGSGLGMPICQKLVEAHDGHIWFESQVGVGTTFYVELPLQPQLEPERV